MLGKTYALAGRIVKPKTIPAVGVGVEKPVVSIDSLVCRTPQITDPASAASSLK